MPEFFRDPQEFFYVLEVVRNISKDPSTLEIKMAGSTVKNKGPNHHDIDLLVVKQDALDFYWKVKFFKTYKIDIFITNPTVIKIGWGYGSDIIHDLYTTGRTLWRKK